MASTPHSYGPVTRHSRLTVLTATTAQLARQPWLGLFKLRTFKTSAGFVFNIQSSHLSEFHMWMWRIIYAS